MADHLTLSLTGALNRRQFIRNAAVSAGALTLAGRFAWATGDPPPRYTISLAAWSLHRMFFASKIDQLGMIRLCRSEFDLDAFEMVSTMWPEPTPAYVRQLKGVADEAGVRLLLIMCDGQGNMSDVARKERSKAVENHGKWVDRAAQLGCHSIRCNVGSVRPDDADAVKRAAESFAALTEYGKKNRIQIIIENHGGVSSDPAWLVSLMKAVDDPFFGTLPDFGNFPPETDKYDAIRRMMPYAKAVSAKCYDFDDTTGLETTIDFPRMMDIVTSAGYRGYVGIEYEGKRLDERTGIKRAAALLKTIRDTSHVAPTRR